MMNRSAPKVANENALRDFADKFLQDKIIAPHDKGGGFLYMKIYNPNNLLDFLATAAVYIPNVFRGDTGSRLIYFEIDLKSALKTVIRE